MFKTPKKNASSALNFNRNEKLIKVNNDAIFKVFHSGIMPEVMNIKYNVFFFLFNELLIKMRQKKKEQRRMQKM